MYALRILGVLAVVAAGMTFAASVDSRQSAYLSAGGDPKPSFSTRRAQRSWTEDTADWRRGTAIPFNEMTGTKDVPAESTIAPRGPTGNRQSGSAVAVGFDGDSGLFWLTARHMVEGCSTIRIAANDHAGGEQHLLTGRILLFHPTADLALIVTAPIYESAISLPIERSAAIAGEATHVGFPGGRPAAIYSEYLGLTRVRWLDGSAPVEAYRVWAERMQVPDNVGRLGGLSGGATMDRTGSVIGTVVGVSERRGRILSTRPSHIATLIGGRAITMASAGGDVRLDQKTFPVFARQLIEQRRVALLNCELSPAAKKEGAAGVAPSR